MSTASSSTARPSSQPRDQLILQVQNVPLVGRLLVIEIFEVPNAALTKPAGTSSSTGRSTPSSASTSARTNGFRVAARDDVENEYSLFVSHQKAEYLYRAAYPVEASVSEMFTSEAMANGILAHLNIIGNRQRDVGKLVCREPEPHVEKKTRVLPVSTPPSKQRNPHLPSKRQDQRAVRVQKTSKRTMEAVAKAMRRPDHDNSGDEESEVEAGKLDRKSSEASLLHRMAVADSKTIWKAELETNYEETDHPLSLVEGNEGNEQKTLVYTLAPGLSPVKRALPERKTKHKDLEERRQRGRQQRILIAQAAQEVNSLGFHGSVQPQDSYSTLVEESENDLSLEGSRRSSVVPVSTTEKQVPQPRASSAPRSSAVVGNAYALKNMPEMGTEEPEQFLRRKTLDAHRSVHVLKRDHWQSDIGMGIEITDERPSLETPPSRLDALLNTARRVMVVNAVGGSLQRSVTSLSDVGETRSSRISSSPSFFTAALSASHSEPILQRPPVEMKESFAASADQTLMEKPHGQMEIPNVPQLNIGAELNKKYSPRPLSKTARAEVRSYPTLGLNLPMEDTSSSTLQRTRRRSAEDISIPMAMAQLKPQKQCAEVEDRMRSRSNSLGSEVIVRLAPLASTLKPLVQEFLATSEPESIVSISEPDVVQEEVCVSSPDPEVVIYPPVELPIETKEKIELVSGKESVDELSAPDLQEDNIQASENDDLHIVNNISSTAEEIQGAEPTAFHLGVPSDAELVVSPHQTARKECWEEPELSIVSPRIHDNAVEDSTVKKRLPETNEFQCENPVELPVSTKGPSSAEIAIAGSPSDLIEPQNEMSQQSNADYSGPLRYDNNEVQDDRGDEDETGTHFESTSFSEDSMYNCPDMPVIGEAEDGDEMDSFAGTIPIILAGVESIHSVDIASNDALDDIVPQDIHLDNDSDHDQPDNDQDTGNSSFLGAATNMNETNIIVLGSDEPSSVKMEVAHPQQAEELLTEVLTKNSVLLNEEGTSAKNRFQETYPMQEENHSEDSINFRQAAEEQQPRDKEVKISAKSKALAGVGLTNNAILKASTGPHRQLADPSPQRQKSGGSTRKKSLSPTKRYDPSSSMAQLKMSVKDVGSRRRSTVAKVANPLPLGKPKLERSHSAEDMKQEILGASRSASTNNPSSTLPDLPLASLKLSVKSSPQKSPGPILRSKSQDSAKRQSSQQSKAVQSVSNYHKKWGKWIAGKNLIEKVGCLQLEELVMADPQNEENLLKLGLRYARWSGTSMQAILLLEHAALLHKNVTGTREYWFWLGSAHLDIFMRHRKYLPVARFHLNRSIRAFTSAFAYMESLADPILLLRYAIGLFWHKGDGNLEKTRDIFHELFSRFVSFCDKDRPNLLFLQFQVLHRLKLYVDAIDCMNRIISLHESLPNQSSSTGAAPVLPSMNSVQHFAVYDAADYCLMLMQCQQASGDYVAAAQSLASVLKHESMQPLRDEEYFDLWFSLAEKCVLHEDYALALEYYAIALNFAKQSQALAAIHYNLGLCFQSLGEDSKCTTEYKRARTANRHVPPLVSLVELTTSYEERFAQLFQKSIVQTIEEVRVELYGRAVRRLQRVFRQSRRNLNINMNNSNSEASQMKMPSLSKRRLSVAAARNLPALVRIEDTGEETEAHEDESSPQQALPSDGNQNSKLDDIALEDVERRHESFLVRKQAAMEEMTALLASPQYRGREVSNTRFKAITQLRSGLLSPEKDQLDARRKQSMETYRQLGYVSSTMPWIEFWEKLLALAPELFESRQALYGSIARIRGRLPLVTDEVAFCALAESIGNVNKAAEKLHDHSYERELTYVCAVVEVSKQLARDFPLQQTQSPLKAPHLSLPTIPSPGVDPTASPSSPSLGGATSRRVVLPPYSPTSVASASCSPKPKAHIRMNQMLDFHFQEHVQKQEAAIAITEATGGFVQQQRRTEKLMVLQDFRQANRVVLSSQLPFGSEKAAT